MTNASATATWRALLGWILEEGAEVSPTSAGAAFRGRTTQELIAYQTVWPMANPVVLCPVRRLGLRFLAAEAAWILSGSNRLDEIAPYAKSLRELSDDGYTMSGAYGPPFVDQVGWVARTLVTDQASRQAVMTLWRPRPGVIKDLPCTVALQWMIRAEPTDGVSRLHCVATMRSSDAWFGVPYDVHTFSMMSAHVAILVRKLSGLGPLLGNLYLTAGSQHLYKLDWPEAHRCIWREVPPDREGDQVDQLLRSDESMSLAPLNLAEYREPHDLTDHLWAVARRQRESLRGSWLVETMPQELPA